MICLVIFLYVENIECIIKFRTIITNLEPLGSYAYLSIVTAATKFTFSEEEALVLDASDGRRAEFITGRESLRKVLGQLGFAPQAILPYASGAPKLPDGAVGSIAHSRKLCCAIAGHDSDFKAIGIDIEGTDRLTKQAAKRVTTADEKIWTGDDQVRASILFSLKESFYKMQFPCWKRLANFEDVSLEVDLTSGTAKIAKISSKFGYNLKSLASQVCFNFSLFDSYVVSICWLRVN